MHCQSYPGDDLRFLVLAVVIGLLFALLLRRLLPYLRTARSILKTIQQVRQSSTAGRFNSVSRKTPAQDRLVCCNVCGTWIPAARALASPSPQLVFCSDKCSAEARKGGKRRAAQ